MYSQELIEYVTKRAEFKARQVVGKVPALGEVEDVQQDLIEDVLRRLPKFDGDRASVKTFVCRIIDNKIADLLKSHEAACRGNGCTKESLDDWVRDETGAWVRRDTTVDACCRGARLGICERSEDEQRDLEMDIASVMASLSPEQRDVCGMLRTKTPSEIARETGMSRSAIYKHIAAIRAAFIKAGLDHYL
ncbi:MAG: sigma-70 family RNA polymerase sigma factor [Verrucomicrobia bacterium]|nr:sigma-70 family RNA polymerase sigma factor [Verrucomicrobiota bacterium]